MSPNTVLPEYCSRAVSGVTRSTHFVALYLCLMCQSGLHAVFDRTSVYFCACPLQNLALPQDFYSLWNDLFAPYLMVLDWRVSRAGPVPFCWPSCSLLFCLQLFSLSLLFLYKLVVWGWGLRTDRMSISLSQPCIANIF